ncbi:RsmB/NOP family class I SAM-dependent RNA methyltransferase [Anaeromyxobacter sp. Fw109-5]|uniref:RsmB/NOP family class I SAM-dependent RNA methyltransferase n=1 Tax=Anaeromyxobacter sp. (strain Fw109-5) TaxID=404589 RepID=UPI000158A83C|nr:RsmB/NOP family class I SAM-dependent RNA methyltransferase [Anaeromyxobacter sp. Fw109-5]ABS28446.1 Fmu (Sun) domain protein [Anaeromyxobacter sp. Fw109-5]
MRPASEERLHEIPWGALAGRAAALDGALAEILAGAPAERIVDRVLRADRGLSREARRALAEALFGVGLWRRRLYAQLGDGAAPARLLLAALLRDLAGRDDAETLAELPPGALPPPRPPPGALADRASLPDWLAGELVAAAGEEAGALADALNLPGPLCLRVNLLRATPAVAAARLAGEGVATRPGLLAPGCLVVASSRPNVYGLGAHREGLVEVQDEGSQLLGALVGARPGESVLDACAGAGGKTLLLAAEVGPAGRVHAVDPDLARLERLRVRAARAGAAGIVALDGAAPAGGLRVDRALVDAPCSELGALRRGPDLRWRLDPAAFAALPPLQLEILERAAACVKPGGRLVYATCTFRRAEDEEVAIAFERAHPEWTRIVPSVGASTVTGDGFVRTWPHRHGTDGFFGAVWKR